MSSQRRIEASRANGARSRGPVTVEGKQRSAQNALRHGMLSQSVVLRDEDPEAFQALLDSLIARLHPSDEVELSLVEEMAAAQWRKRRAWGIETAMMNDAAASSRASDPLAAMTRAFTALATTPELAVLHRYEARQTRMFQRALQNLVVVRKQNLPNEPNPISEHEQLLPLPDAPAAEPPQPPPPDPPAEAEPAPVAASQDIPEPPPAPAPPRAPEPVREPELLDLISDFSRPFTFDFLPPGGARRR